MTRADAIIGSLLATAVGDALGLPFEGLSRSRIARLKPTDRYRLLPGHGMVSDDTDHAALVVLALAASAGDPELFERKLRNSLRRWFFTLPAGVGKATARSCMRMCLGVRRPGVRSAGNGPAMRAAVLGAAIDDPLLLAELVRRSTELTHIDPRAIQASLAVALVARSFRKEQPPDADGIVTSLHERMGAVDPQLAAELEAVVATLHIPTTDFALSRGHTRGVSGFVVHSVPIALHAAFANPRDPVAAALACIACGGDTDTTAAIAAGIVGAGTGPDAIPALLLDRIIDWPRGVDRLEQWGGAAARALDTRTPTTLPQPLYPLCLARNLFFLSIILAHAARRALPPC